MMSMAASGAYLSHQAAKVVQAFIALESVTGDHLRDRFEPLLEAISSRIKSE
jgi:hypothetical protein